MEDLPLEGAKCLVEVEDFTTLGAGREGAASTSLSLLDGEVSTPSFGVEKDTFVSTVSKVHYKRRDYRQCVVFAHLVLTCLARPNRSEKYQLLG